MTEMQVAAKSLSAACPLCASRERRQVLTVPYDVIWERLAALKGSPLSPAVVARHTPQAETALYVCDRCGLQYFSPCVPGDGEFYAELGGDGYYESDRWEFGLVADRLGPGDAVVDLGCGKGDFLRQIANRVARAVGVDHNLEAIDALRAAGIEGVSTRFADFAAGEAGRFDVVCGFQILEHVRRVGDLMEPAMR